jgi:hypothetical protein
VRGALVADRKSPPTRARRSSMPIAAESDRSGPSNNHNSWVRVESRFQRDLHITDYIHGCRDDFSHAASHDIR